MYDLKSNDSSLKKELSDNTTSKDVNEENVMMKKMIKNLTLKNLDLEKEISKLSYLNKYKDKYDEIMYNMYYLNDTITQQIIQSNYSNCLEVS